MVPLTLRYDLRAPGFGPPAADLYAAMLEQCVWAEQHGAWMVALSEHHGAEDGYCPSPVVVASAIAGRTTTMRVLVSALVLPLYEPIRLAEEMAVLDLVSGGRVDYILGAGYVTSECAMFDIDPADRVDRLEEGIGVLRAAWSGEPFEFRGRQVRVTPRPLRPAGPMLLLGGSTPASARRAARLADGYIPIDASLWPEYERACKELGRTPVGLAPEPGPLFIHVANDPDRAWARIAPHAMHDADVYDSWLTEGQGTAKYTAFADADALRASGQYAVMTPDECVEFARTNGGLRLHPLMGGLPPDLSWESLELIAAEVLPALAAQPDDTPDDSEGALR